MKRVEQDRVLNSALRVVRWLCSCEAEKPLGSPGARFPRNRVKTRLLIGSVIWDH
jgi:hypothetical protein